MPGGPGRAGVPSSGGEARSGGGLRRVILPKMKTGHRDGRIARWVAWAICLAGIAGLGVGTHAAVVEDLFHRDLGGYGIVVPDWEGYMANPAIEFFIAPPDGAMLPVSVTLAGNDPRLYFDLPSTAGPQGPRKEIQISTREPDSVHIAIFPARKKHNAEHLIGILIRDARGRQWRDSLPVHEVAVQTHDSAPTHPILVDYSQDKTGFYRDPIHRETFEQAVADWQFYLADLHVDPVPAGSEKTWIFEPSGFAHGRPISNASAYTGTQLYTYGISTSEIRSGGEPSGQGKFQTVNGKPLPIHRSGGVEVEIRGNYNTRGWSPYRDDEWFRAMIVGQVPSDLYSVVHHEMGHALFFNPANKNFHRGGELADPALHAYLGFDPRIDIHDHFDGTVDPVSLHGAFGNEYHGKTPLGRWLITKTDLLAAQAIGYKLRKTAPFVELTITTEQLPPATSGRAYKANLVAEGGVPFYDWSITAGELPPGLLLNRFTGQIIGNPKKVGTFQFTIQARDYQKEGTGVSQPFTIAVARQ